MTTVRKELNCEGAAGLDSEVAFLLIARSCGLLVSTVVDSESSSI